MFIQAITELGNGMLSVSVVGPDGFISNHVCAEGQVSELMKDLRAGM